MTAIVSVEEYKNIEFKVLTKGAPEIIKTLLKYVPAHYDRGYLKYVKTGARVLAIYREHQQRLSLL